ncbi:MAG: hypothetical protein OQK82_00395 [Candidatus Pacearchaeota archaeon]|nr:hypothetical protein [Candidatus Pacearchaeota archaeon]
MNEIKYTLIGQAIEQYTDIYPVVTKKKLRDCFTTEGDLLMFWFNTSDESTHVITSRLPGNALNK